MPTRLSKVALLKELLAVAVAVQHHSIFPSSDRSDIMSWLMLCLTGNKEGSKGWDFLCCFPVTADLMDWKMLFFFLFSVSQQR